MQIYLVHFAWFIHMANFFSNERNPHCMYLFLQQQAMVLRCREQDILLGPQQLFQKGIYLPQVISASLTGIHLLALVYLK